MTNVLTQWAFKIAFLFAVVPMAAAFSLPKEGVSTEAGQEIGLNDQQRAYFSQFVGEYKAKDTYWVHSSFNEFRVALVGNKLVVQSNMGVEQPQTCGAHVGEMLEVRGTEKDIQKNKSVAVAFKLEMGSCAPFVDDEIIFVFHPKADGCGMSPRIGASFALRHRYNPRFPATRETVRSGWNLYPKSESICD